MNKHIFYGNKINILLQTYISQSLHSKLKCNITKGQYWRDKINYITKTANNHLSYWEDFIHFHTMAFKKKICLGISSSDIYVLLSWCQNNALHSIHYLKGTTLLTLTLLLASTRASLDITSIHVDQELLTSMHTVCSCKFFIYRITSPYWHIQSTWMTSDLE
jgi:hypothetical protein